MNTHTYTQEHMHDSSYDIGRLWDPSVFCFRTIQGLCVKKMDRYNISVSANKFSKNRMQTGRADCLHVCLADAQRTGGPKMGVAGIRTLTAVCMLEDDHKQPWMNIAARTEMRTIPLHTRIIPHATFPLPCSTKIIVKQSNFSHFPASIISVISLFIRVGGGGQTAEKGHLKGVIESIKIREIEWGRWHKKSDGRRKRIKPWQS